MEIYGEVYNNLINSYPYFPPEVGCMIGCKNGIITDFIFDKGIKTNANTYVPDIAFLNNCIEKWQQSGIEFIGLIHSHYKNINLSNSDIEAINKIMLNMPEGIETLYFPIILPNFKQICCFKALKKDKNVKITEENIKIV